MKAQAERAELSAALAWVDKAVGTGMMPATTAVRIVADEGRLTLTTTDIESFATTSIPAKIDEPGTALVPRHVAKVAARLPDQPVTLALEDRLSLTCGRTEASVASIEPSQFPSLSGVEGDEIVLSAAVIDFARTHLAPLTEDKPERAFLAGVHVEIGEGRAILEATDQYRLHRMVVEGEGGGEGIVPPRLLAAGLEGDVRLVLDERAASLSDGERTIVSTLIQAKCPDYAKALDLEGAALTVERQALLTALGRIEAVTGRDRLPEVDLSCDGDVLELSGSRDDGAMRDEIDAFADGPWGLTVNPAYLGSLVKAHDSEQVTLISPGPKRPVLITSDDERLTSLVMPISK